MIRLTAKKKFPLRQFSSSSIFMHSHIKLNAIESYSYVFYCRDVKKKKQIVKMLNGELFGVQYSGRRSACVICMSKMNRTNSQKWDGETVTGLIPGHGDNDLLCCCCLILLQ
jgi:hypothetical protein